MIGIIRFGYGVPEITVGVFRADKNGLPKLIHIEQFSNPAAALSELQKLVGAEPVVTIQAGPTELFPAEYVPEEDRASGFVPAQFFIDNGVLVSRLDASILAGLPGGPVLAEAGCLVTAFKTAYESKLNQYNQVAHLHLSENQLDLFVYNRGELSYHGREIPEFNDEADYETALCLLLGDENGMWRDHLELLVVSGASPFIGLNSIRGIEPQLGAEIVEPFDFGRLYVEDLADGDAQRSVNASGGKLSRVALPVLLAGAAHARLNNHGADFRRQLNSSAGARKGGKGFSLPVLFGTGNQSFNTLAGKLGSFGVGLGVLGLFVILAFQFLGARKRENDLNAQFALETKRAEANRTLKTEAENYKTFLEALNARIEVINRMRKSQEMNYQISNTVRWNVPSEIVLTTLKIDGRNVTITGYVTVENAAAAPPKQDGQPTPSATPVVNRAVDTADPVTTFVQKLESSGDVFGDVQSRYTRTEGNKSEFMITCVYKGEVVTDPIQVQPIPALINEAGGTPQTARK